MRANNFNIMRRKYYISFPTLLISFFLIAIAHVFNSCSSSGSDKDNKDFHIPDIIFDTKPNIEGEWHRVTTQDNSALLRKLSVEDGDDTFYGEAKGEETYTFNDDGTYSLYCEAIVDARGFLKTNDAFIDFVFISKPMEMTFSANFNITGTYTYDTDAETLLLTQSELEIIFVEFNCNYGFVNSLMKESVENMLEKQLINLLPNNKTNDYEINVCTEKQLVLQDDEEIAKYVRVTY